MCRLWQELCGKEVPLEASKVRVRKREAKDQLRDVSVQESAQVVHRQAQKEASQHLIKSFPN